MQPKEISKELTDLINLIFDGEMNADEAVQARIINLRDRIEEVA